MKKLFTAAVLLSSLVGSFAMASGFDLSKSVTIKEVGYCAPQPTMGDGKYCPETDGPAPDCFNGYTAKHRWCYAGSEYVHCGWVCERDPFTSGGN